MAKETGYGDDPERGRRVKKTYYEILGVSQSADSEAIKSAFRKKAKETHPDKPENRGKEEEFKDVNEAYQILSDPEMRRRYNLSFQTSSTVPPRQETPRQQPPREQPSRRQETNPKREKPQTSRPPTDFGFGVGGFNFEDMLKQSRQETERIMRESRVETERIMRESRTENERFFKDLREQQRKAREMVVTERSGLFIGKQGDIITKEFLLDPSTKKPISKGYDQILIRDGLVIGSNGFIHPEFLLNRKTGQVIGGYRGYDRIERRQNKVMGIRHDFMKGDIIEEIGTVR
jgi:curved DNA-binding protein CbpA